MPDPKDPLRPPKDEPKLNASTRPAVDSDDKERQERAARVGPENLTPHGHDPEDDTEHEGVNIAPSAHHPTMTPGGGMNLGEVEKYQYPDNQMYWELVVTVKPGWPLIEAEFRPKQGDMGEVHMVQPVLDVYNVDHALKMWDDLMYRVRGELEQNLREYGPLRKQDDGSWK